MKTQIRLLLEEQSDQGLHCFQYCLHLLDAFLCKDHFRVFTVKLVGVRKTRNFTAGLYMAHK